MARPIDRGATLRAFWLPVMAVAMLLVQVAMAHAKASPDSFADLAEKVSPAVVNITTSTVVAAASGDGPMVPDGSPFEDFFQRLPGQATPAGSAPPPPRRAAARRWARAS